MGKKKKAAGTQRHGRHRMGRELFGKGKENMIEQKNPSVYDYDACRALWQRVSPSEDPYPAAEEVGTPSGEISLPGAEGDPCCMGTEAADSVEVLQGFLREELGDAQVYSYLAANLPRRETARLFCARPCRRDLPDHRKALLPARMR